MRFAMDTFRDIAFGTRDRRIHAIFTLGLWFVAGAFLASTVQYYVAPFESTAASVAGGALISAIAAALKLS
jgi:uncharacterized membrane protein YraQ (UPF0718 family)